MPHRESKYSTQTPQFGIFFSWWNIYHRCSRESSWQHLAHLNIFEHSFRFHPLYEREIREARPSCFAMIQWQSFNNAETGTAQRCSVAHHSPKRVFCDAKHKKISPFVYRHRRYLLAFPLSSSLSKTNIAKFTTIRNEVRKRKRIAADDDNISANEKMRKVYRKYETFYIRHAVQNWHLMPNCQPFRKKLSLHSNCRHHSFSGERKNAAKHGTMNAISVNTQNLFDLSFAIQNSVLFVCIS